MTELIKITENNGNKAVSARELHVFLESKQEFANWIKSRIDKYGLIENQDFEVFDNFIKNPDGGRPLKEYILKVDTAKELAMVEGNEKGKLARLYFIEMEKKAKEPQQVLIGTPRQEKRKQQAELLNLIKMHLHRGDRKQVTEAHGFSKTTVDNVMKGSSFNPAIIKALFDKALQNKQNLGAEIPQMINLLK